MQEAGLRDRLQGHIDSWVIGKSRQGSLQIPACPHLLWDEGATCRSPACLGWRWLAVLLTAVELTATLEG